MRASSAFLIAALLAFIGLSAAPASAQTLNVWPATWRTDGNLSGFPTCQAALNASLSRARNFWNDPLVLINGSGCVNAVEISPGPPPDYRLEWRRTTQEAGTPNHASNMSPECVDGLLQFNNTRGWFCTPPSGSVMALRQIGDCPDCRSKVGNPVFPGFGNKMQRELDYAGSGPFPLRLERVHNSARAFVLKNLSGLSDSIGTSGNWTHSYERRLTPGGATQGNDPKAPIATLSIASVSRPDGRAHAFSLVSGVWTPDVHLRGERLEKLTSGWKLTSSEDEIELYDEEGKLLSISDRAGLTQTLAYYTTDPNLGLLQSVTDPFGRTLTFTYTDRRLASVTIPGGGTITYGYSNDAHKQLVTVTYPDSAVRTYHYENAGAYKPMLTGITDELGVRYATWGYETGQGRATLSQHAGGADKVTISYSGTTALVTRFVTSTVSSTNTYNFQTLNGVILNNGITGPACPQCGPVTTGFTAEGLPNFMLHWSGGQSTFGWDTARTLRVTELVGRGVNGAILPESTIFNREFHSTFRLPLRESQPLQLTTSAYDPDGTQCGARGALCSRSVSTTADPTGFQGVDAVPTGTPRVWTYTYNANGQALTVNGPRTDVTDTTAYTYYANNDADLGKRGGVATITNAAGHVTQVTAYNVHGQPLTIVDPNGLTTTLAYDARQRLTSHAAGSETTTYEYNLAGLLTKVTLPDGSFLSYGYDAAHRLTTITDNLGNSITYTLDLAGNRTAEQVKDPSNTLVQTRTRVYSSLNRLFQELGALSQTTEYTYDNEGNVLTVKDPLNRTTTNQYDFRNRLKQVTDPATGIAQYGYNGQSALTSVKDPRNLTTTYAMSGFGDLSSQVSPDTGTTTNTYDLAGNLATQTDAKSQVTTYAYDALNRVTLVTFHDASSHAYAYDAGTNGLGRLTSITEKNPSNVTVATLAYIYDAHGRVISEARTVNGITYTTAYSYTNGQLTGMTYPSGRTLAYSRDSTGRATQITTSTGTPQVVVENVAYHPYGMARSWTFGNTQTYARTVDQDGRISSYTLGGVSSSVGFDTASRITGIGANTYGYDTLDRLNSATALGTTYGYTYDAVGNRLTKTVSGNADTYTYSGTSNRIATLTPFGSTARSFVLDANGSTTSDAVNSFVYDVRGRMVQSTNVSSLVTSYQVNALGQRIRKTNTNEDTVFTYDGEGRLIAENDAAGTLKREYIYLGDIPVGVVQGGALAFVHPDHLNTPRLISNDQQQVVWRNDQQEPFGNSPPNENPSGLGVFPFPLRESNYYADVETNQRYAMFRDCFDSATGRFCQSDPIGLAGGLNTFSYAYNNPISLYDPDGLCACDLTGCIGKCIKNYGGDYALIALGLGSPFASVPYPGNKQLLGSTNRYTSLFSMATRSLGFSGVARVARSLNPVANVAAAGAAGYLLGLSANCGIRCAVNCDQ